MASGRLASHSLPLPSECRAAALGLWAVGQTQAASRGGTPRPESLFPSQCEGGRWRTGAEGLRDTPGSRSPSLTSALAHYPTLWDLTFPTCEMDTITLQEVKQDGTFKPRRLATRNLGFSFLQQGGFLGQRRGRARSLQPPPAQPAGPSPLGPEGQLQMTAGATPVPPGVKADTEPWRCHLPSTPVLWAGPLLPCLT